MLGPGAEFPLGHPESSSLMLPDAGGTAGLGSRFISVDSCRPSWALRPPRSPQISMGPFIFLPRKPERWARRVASWKSSPFPQPWGVLILVDLEPMLPMAPDAHGTLPLPPLPSPPPTLTLLSLSLLAFAPGAGTGSLEVCFSSYPEISSPDTCSQALIPQSPFPGVFPGHPVWNCPPSLGPFPLLLCGITI